MKPIRDLRANEIDCRVQSVKEKGLILLLYKDARVDMNILDETFGAENWQREHYECKGNLFCRIGVKIGDEWVWKSDCGTESNTEAQKGEASDSFKRAGFNWGIGRELYTAPLIWVNADKCNIDKGKCYDNFAVQSITIENKTITALTIYNEKKKCVAFTFGKSAPATTPKEQPKALPLLPDPLDDPNEHDKTVIRIMQRRLDEKVQSIMAIYEQGEGAVKKTLAKNAGIAKAETQSDYKALIAEADKMLNDRAD